MRDPGIELRTSCTNRALTDCAILALTMRDVVRVSDLLPGHSKIEWIRKYHELPPADKIHPFDEFMKFLDKEWEAVIRLE